MKKIKNFLIILLCSFILKLNIFSQVLEYNINRVSCYTHDRGIKSANGLDYDNISHQKKVIAVSPDILPLIPLGSKVYLKIKGYYSHLSGYYEVVDVTNSRFVNTVDVYFKDLQKLFLINNAKLILY